MSLRWRILDAETGDLGKKEGKGECGGRGVLQGALNMSSNQYGAGTIELLISDTSPPIKTASCVG